MPCMTMPTPHLEKIKAAIENAKLPAKDRGRLREAVKRYHAWIVAMRAVAGSPEEMVTQLVSLMNEYKLHFDMDLIFDSSEDFLYRQKGQLKLDNSIIEEFLPWIVRPPILPGLTPDVQVGPAPCYSDLYFESALGRPGVGGEPKVRDKAQDFAVARKIFIRTSYHPSFEGIASRQACIAYVAAEIKTNLDKTMFQEACATAHDVKSAVAGSRYFLLCEWLDMTPLSTSGTDINEVLILRGKRLAANVREHFSTLDGRRRHRDQYEKYLKDRPFRADVLMRFVRHIGRLLTDDTPLEDDAVARGFF